MVNIRPECTEDFSRIYTVNHQAFNNDIEPQLVEAIRKSENYIPDLSLVAITDNKVIGHILFSKIVIQTNNGDIPALALAPVAVIPEYQKQGIGTKLIKYGLQESKKLGFKIVVVLGHPDYYPRFGFTPASTKNVKSPFEVPDEAFMLYELESGALDNICGVVKYPPEFGV